MLLARSLRLSYRMCQITPEIYDTLYKQFGKTLDLATLGKYYSSQNLVEVYNIIKHTKMKAEDKLSFYNKIEQQICKDNTDMELNVLANIHRDKSIIYEHHGNSAEAVIQIERAVQAIQSMEHPFNLEVASLMQNAANLHVRFKNYTKAQKFLKDAEHMLNMAQQDLLENSTISLEVKQNQMKQINFLMAKVMSEFCLVHMQLLHPFQSRSYLGKAMDRWKNVENKNTMAYLMTIKFKCILHSWLKQDSLAISTAKQYLSEFEPTQQTIGHRMWFMKFLVDKGIDTYSNQLKQNIEQLSKTLPQKDLTDFLMKLGIIKKREDKPRQPE